MKTEVTFKNNGKLKLLIIVGTRPGDYPPGSSDQKVSELF